MLPYEAFETMRTAALQKYETAIAPSWNEYVQARDALCQPVSDGRVIMIAEFLAYDRQMEIAKDKLEAYEARRLLAWTVYDTTIEEVHDRFKASSSVPSIEMFCVSCESFMD